MNINFEMSTGDKVRSERALMDKKIKLEGLQNKVTKFTHDNTQIRQDEIVLELDRPFIEYKPSDSTKTYRLAFVRGNNFTIRAAGENLRNQSFKETAQSAYATIVNNPTDFLHQTSNFCVICDSVEVQNDGMTVVLHGNIQIRDGGTRALLVWEMQEYMENMVHIFKENLASMVIPINIQTRAEFVDSVDMTMNSASRNVSTPVKIYNIAVGAGIFDKVQNYFGAYAPLLSLKGVDKRSPEYGKKYDARVFIDDMLCLDPYMHHSEISPDVSNYGTKSPVKSYCDKTIKLARNNHLVDAQNLMNYMRPIGEDIARLTEFLNFEFLMNVYKNCPDYLHVFVGGSNKSKEVKPKHKGVFSVTNPDMEQMFSWNFATRRVLLMGIRSLIREGASGLYFEHDPIELLSDPNFMECICEKIDSVQTISKDSIGDTKIVKSSVDSRYGKDVNIVYNSFVKYTDMYVRMWSMSSKKVG